MVPLIWRRRSTEERNDFSISSRHLSLSSRDQACRALHQTYMIDCHLGNRLSIYIYQPEKTRVSEPYGCDLVKLVAGILLQLAATDSYPPTGRTPALSADWSSQQSIARQPEHTINCYRLPCMVPKNWNLQSWFLREVAGCTFLPMRTPPAAWPK